MPIETTSFQISVSQLPLGQIFKIMIIIFLVFYGFFAIIVIRQVNLMTHTIITPLSKKLNLAATIHLIVSLVLLIVAIIFL